MFTYPYSVLVGSLSLAALSFAFSAPAQAIIVFDFFWTGNPVVNSDISVSDDATLQATGTVTINKPAGQSFGLNDITATNITVTGDTITTFDFTSWTNAEGTIAGDGLSASFSGTSFYALSDGSQLNTYFGCQESGCANGNIQVVANGSFRSVAYSGSQANALASMTMTAQPVPLESDAGETHTFLYIGEVGLKAWEKIFSR